MMTSIFVKSSLRNLDLSGDGQIDAFSFEVKNAVQSANLSGLSVEVDGETIPPELVEVGLSGRKMKLVELSRQSPVSFPFGSTAKLTVTKKGGLSQGNHTIQLRITEAFFGTFTFSTEEAI